MWANWGNAERKQVPDTQDEQWETKRVLAAETWSYPVNSPPSPPFEPSEAWRNRMEKDLFLARTMLNDLGTTHRSWINCEVMTPDAHGVDNVETFLELLSTLTPKNRRYLV